MGENGGNGGERSWWMMLAMSSFLRSVNITEGKALLICLNLYSTDGETNRKKFHHNQSKYQFPTTHPQQPRFRLAHRCFNVNNKE